MARLTSLERALRVLDGFSPERPVLGVGEASLATGIDKSSVSRVMAKLAELGYLTRSGPGRYGLGRRLFELGVLVHPGLRLEEAARPLLTALARRSDCAAQVSVPDGDHALVVASAESTTLLRFSVALGTRVPLHASSAGKVLCAFRRDLLAMVPSQLPRFTDGTITDRDLFLLQVARTRERGYALAQDEFFPGQFSVSAPVRDRHRVVTAALTAVAGRPLVESEIDHIRGLVLDTAADLTKVLSAPPLAEAGL